ncbi:MAG TPA: DUF1634 domain-containing protein [Thermoanaerobaculia bacterium]|jgi:hypothetical protein
MVQPEVGESARDHQWVQAVLRAGLALAVASMVVGLGICAAAGRCDPRGLRPSDLGRAISAGPWLVTAGALALALTPAVRVLALVVLWGRAHDWRFVAIALAVVCVLGASILVGAG